MTQLEPAGFGNCGVCPFMQSGSVRVCYACASQSFEQLPSEPRCDICDGVLNEAGRCRNRICNWAVEERYFQWVWAIAMNTGELRRAIHRYKYSDKWGWARIFGRVLAGYLDRTVGIFGEYDLIIPSPTYVGPGGRGRDHIGDILDAAAVESTFLWPFERNALVKTAPTPSMVGTSSWHERWFIARTQLRVALQEPERTLVHGRRIFVFDDVFTGGHTLTEVARALRHAGATEVSELVLARQPWSGT
jgi:predicted amidophosphoribosyltransferase